MQELIKVFRGFAASTPDRRGADLSSLFSRMEPGSSHFVREAYDAMLETLSLPSDHPLARAGKDIADRIDSTPTAENYGGHGNGYHNRNHMFEVPTAATGLILIHAARGYEPKLSAQDKLVLLVAAVAHDIGHNGEGNGFGDKRVPLLTEGHAIRLAKDLIRPHYTDESQFEKTFARLETIIAATDIGGGDKSPGKFFADYAKYHRGEIDAPPTPPIPELEKFVPLLQNDPVLSHMCILMQDADLLPSIGLTTDWAQTQDMRLTKEFTKGKSHVTAIDPEKALGFYENVAVLNSQAGQEFQPNFDTIKAHARSLLTDINEFNRDNF